MSFPRPTIDATVRTETGKGPNRRLRASGQIPAIVYGQGVDNTSLSVNPKDIAKALNGPLGYNTLVELKAPEWDTPKLALMRQFQVHPWKRNVTHVDFWSIGEDTRLTVKVPFRRVGRANIEKIGGKIRQTQSDVRISCLPAHMPAAVEFDMSTLADDKYTLKISEVPMPEGVEIVFKLDYTIIQVKAPKVVAEG